MPVYIQTSILDAERIYLNGGKRGSLVSLDPKDAHAVLQAELVDVMA
jgi:prolyl-tRNA editing enzyme YbaK/EbsC (Cys-tRNA(Pro) deacylase)